MSVLTAPLRVSKADFFGIPDSLFPEIIDIEDLLLYLNKLEKKNKRPGIKKRFFGLGAVIPELSFASSAPSGASGRTIFERFAEDVVVKYDADARNYLAGKSGNPKEYKNDTEYRKISHGIWGHFPVLGITDLGKFLIMYRAVLPDDALYKTALAVANLARSYVPDSAVQNFGYLVDREAGFRYWASVDIDFGTF